VDTSYEVYSLGEAVEVVLYETVTLVVKLSIFSAPNSESITQTDLLNAVNVFDKYTTSIVIFTLIMTCIVLRMTKIHKYWYEYCQLIFHQQSFTSKYCILLLCILLLLYVFNLHVSADFKADLSVIQKPKTIDSLRDLAESNSTPNFMAILRLEKWFERSNNKWAKLLWKRMLNVGLDKVVVPYSSSVSWYMKSLPLFLDGRIVNLMPLDLESAAVRLGCTLYGELAMKRMKTGAEMRVSTPFYEILMGVPIRKTLEKSKRDKLRQLYVNNGNINTYKLIECFIT